MNNINKMFYKEIEYYNKLNGLNYKTYVKDITETVKNLDILDQYELYKCLYKIFIFGVNRFKLIKNEDNKFLQQYFKKKLSSHGYKEDNKINFKDIYRLKKIGEKFEYVDVINEENTQEILSNVIGVLLMELYDNPIKMMGSTRRQEDLYYTNYIKSKTILFLELYNKENN